MGSDEPPGGRGRRVQPRRRRDVRRRDRAADRRLAARAGLRLRRPRRRARRRPGARGDRRRRRRRCAAWSSPPAAPGSRPPTARRRRPRRCSTARCPASPRRSARPGVAKGVPTAMLSRGLAGIAGDCLVVNLPGSRGGVKDGLGVLEPVSATPSSRSSGATTDTCASGAWPAAAGPPGSESHGSWSRAASLRQVRRRRVAGGPRAATTTGCGRGTPPCRRAPRRARRRTRWSPARLLRQAKQGQCLPFVDRGRRPLRRAGHGQQRRARLGAVGARSATGSPPRSPAAGSRRARWRMVIDHCLGPVGLHRIEICVRPGEHQLPAGGGEARSRAGGLRPALPAHRRRLARPPDLRGHRRGVPLRAWSRGSRHTSHTSSSATHHLTSAPLALPAPTLRAWT